jgi:multimeric flavodoxin WrbA
MSLLLPALVPPSPPSFLSHFPSFLPSRIVAHASPTGSPWGAGTYAASDGSRQPTALELEIATIQGKVFYGVVSKVKF